MKDHTKYEDNLAPNIGSETLATAQRLTELLERDYNPPALFILEEVELGSGYHRLSVSNAGHERDWCEPYTKSSTVRYRSRIVRVPYPPRFTEAELAELERGPSAKKLFALEDAVKALEQQLAERDATIENQARELDSMRRRWHDLERIQDRQLTFGSVAMELADSNEKRRWLEKELLRLTEERDATVAGLRNCVRAGNKHLELRDADVAALREALANARDEGPWAWSSADDNHLESMGDGMVIQISAGQLRGLLAERDATSAQLERQLADISALVPGRGEVVERVTNALIVKDTGGKRPQPLGPLHLERLYAKLDATHKALLSANELIVALQLELGQ